MIYLNSDRTEFIDSDAFIACGNEAREDLNREYHAPTAQELYDFLDSQPTWDSAPADAYEQLADLCGVDITQADGSDTLMDRCAAALEEDEKEEKEMTTSTYDINGIEVTRKQLMRLADYVTRRTGTFCGISLVSLPDDEDIAGYLAKNGVPVEDGMCYVDRGEAGDFPASKDADALLPALAREVEAAFPSRKETAEALKRA